MQAGDHFNKLWNRYDDFDFSDPPLCQFAIKFADWIDTYCRLNEEPTHREINQNKLMLQDRYFDWYNAVPRGHRRRIGGPGHICVYHVYMGAYERLKVAELSLLPPGLFVTARPSLPQYGGLFLGEVSDE